jgi:hypothetical protein
MDIINELETTPLTGNGRLPGQWQEVGSPGLDIISGFIRAAYSAELTWPTVFPIYNRIRRADPEVGGIVRPTYNLLARRTTLDVLLPDKPSSDDQRAGEFLSQVLDDFDVNEFLETLVSYVPFLGWGWWETLLGLRRQGWRPPGDDDWRSQYNDGRVGLRRLAFRDHSSFDSWDINERNGRLNGLWQHDFPNPRAHMPLSRSLHITFGDPNNPEGLAPLEAVYRLERIKFGLEVVQGIGFEHTAGHLSVTAENTVTTEDKLLIQKAARAIMSTQQGNYAVWPQGFKGEIIDSNFTAAGALLEAIRYYGLLKLQIFNSQWVAMATTGGTGAYSAHKDSTEMGIMSFNGMMAGFASQFDNQVVRRLFEHPLNRDAFPGMTRRPRVVATPVEKAIPLNELAAFVSAIVPILPLGDEDIIAIRRKSDFLPESLPAKPLTGMGKEDKAAEDDEEEESMDMDEQEAEMIYADYFWCTWCGGPSVNHPADCPGNDSPDHQRRGEWVDRHVAAMSHPAAAVARRRLVQHDTAFNWETHRDAVRGRVEELAGELGRPDTSYLIGALEMAESWEDVAAVIRELNKRPFAVPAHELPADVLAEAAITETDIGRAVRKFDRWAARHAPGLRNLLNAKEGKAANEE